MRMLDLALESGLVGVQLERADLRGRNLSGANLTNANLRMADLTDADLRGITAVHTDFSGAKLLRADLEGANLVAADFTGAYLRAANFSYAKMWTTMLRRVSAKNAIFFQADMTYVDFNGGEFLGSRFNGAILDGARNVDRAIFYWWLPSDKGKPVYEARPGYVRRERSAMGGISLPENAGRKTYDG